MENFTYLALGDSYTIGESVPLQENFPYQTVHLLRQKGLHFSAPEIIAKTGWTTDELLEAMEEHHFLTNYDFVSLLIGVNNQYRGWPIEVYEKELEKLINKAVVFAGNEVHRIAILSIPDYSATPFGQSLNKEKISLEIDQFNSINKRLAEKFHLHYIDITAGTREAVYDKELIAADGLHPSEIEYSRWADKLSEIIFNAVISQ